MSEDLRQENARLHGEIRSLNGQLEGLARILRGANLRIEKLQQENIELKRKAGENP